MRFIEITVRLLSTICVSVFLLAAGSVPGVAQEKTAKQAKAKKWVGPKSTPRQQLELLMQMPPEEREQYLAQLPPAQRTRLEELEKMPEDKRALQLRRLDILNSLTAERKQAVTQEIGSIKLMSFVRRRARLHSREFEQSYTADEQELIRDTFPAAAQ